MKQRKIVYSLIAVVVVLLVGALILIRSGAFNSSSQSSGTTVRKQSSSQKRQAGRTLIVYYSLTGNTDRLARTIHKQGNIALARIRTNPAYSAATAGDRIKREQAQNSYDKLENVPNLKRYKTILLGFPIWYSDVSYPIQSFLATNEKALSGKRIIPFSTSASGEASAIRQSVRTIRRLAPNNQIGKGLNVTSSDITRQRVQNWLQQTVFNQTNK